MRHRNVNALWLQCILEELEPLGVKHAVVCPGARSGALCIALYSDQRIKVLAQTDERSAAFIALGVAKVTLEPVFIVTTSGSAVANLVPALTEAHAANVPLVLLTCDRPRAFRNARFGQMIDHIGACASFVLANVDLPDPSDAPESVANLRDSIHALVCRYLSSGMKGVLHINVPLEGKHDTSEQSAGFSPRAFESKSGRNRAPLDSSGADEAGPAAENLRSVEGWFGRSMNRGLIIAGPCSIAEQRILSDVAAMTGLPVLADVTSGGRRPKLETMVQGYDVLSSLEGTDHFRPDFIIRFGLAPVLPAVQEFLLANPCKTIVISEAKVSKDYLHSQFLWVPLQSARIVGEVIKRKHAPSISWKALWTTAGERGRNSRLEAVKSLGWGEVKAASMVCSARGFDLLHLANSLSIRHAEMLLDGNHSQQTVLCNRGVSGIDGTLGTFIGELWGMGRRGLALVGDQAFLHDLPALAAAKKAQLRGTVCVMNNEGGALFDLLPLSRLPGYLEVIRCAPAINIEHAARCFSLQFERCTSEDELASTLDAAQHGEGLRIVEIVVPARKVAMDLLAMQRAMRVRARGYAKARLEG